MPEVKVVNHSSAKFTCVPVTDYHKMVENERKRAMKDSEDRIGRNRPKTQGTRSKNMKLGITCSDTQWIGYRGKFSS